MLPMTFYSVKWSILSINCLNRIIGKFFRCNKYLECDVVFEKNTIVMSKIGTKQKSLCSKWNLFYSIHVKYTLGVFFESFNWNIALAKCSPLIKVYVLCALRCIVIKKSKIFETNTDSLFRILLKFLLNLNTYNEASLYCRKMILFRLYSSFNNRALSVYFWQWIVCCLNVWSVFVKLSQMQWNQNKRIRCRRNNKHHKSCIVFCVDKLKIKNGNR